MTRRSVSTLLIALSAFVALSTLATRARAAPVVCGPPTDGFYQPPAAPALSATTQGALLRCELLETRTAAELGASSEWRGSAKEAPAVGYRHYRILYLSQGPIGKPTVVSATVYLPTGASGTCEAKLAAPIAAVQHGTTGMADDCAPSKHTAWFDYMALPLLGRGMAIVATDYQGLGTPGIHPYLVGEPEGYSVLDGVRALTQLPDAAGCLGHEVVLVGHSQGGQATLFAAQLVATYGLGKGLHAAGAVAWAPAFGEAPFADGKKEHPIPARVPTTLGMVFYVMYLYGAAHYHGAPADSLWLTPAAVAKIPDLLEKDCDQGLFTDVPAQFPTLGTLYTQAFLDDASAEPWASYIRADVPGQVHHDVPTLVVQGSEDKLVLPQATQCLVDRMTRLHDPVSPCVVSGGHMGVVGASWKGTLPWIEAVAHGHKPPALTADCAGTLPACK